MHEIFINYRTHGGKEVAYMFDRALSARFGHDNVFLARKSIDVGTNYADVLVRAARHSQVLLALIDKDWLDAPDRNRPGRRALDNPDDWVRREIEEALASGALVVPVFVGRKVEQLDPRRLPRSLAELAECQYTRVELSTFDADMNVLADRLVRQVPALAALERSRSKKDPEAPDHADTVHTDHQSGGIGIVTGSVGTFINDARGPLHAGRGNQYNGPHITGDGTNYIAGDNHGGIRQGFGSRTPRGGGEQ
ncbi:toll/interleukin-1 receptor domain-containing protein [Streptomyces sp. NPDC000877]|uniref:toll/interleukin-1 receptor domain-containing protein n=1 Tax=unclassified Streptomyces TaxID=2593676 RepID=UPI00331ED018